MIHSTPGRAQGLPPLDEAGQNLLRSFGPRPAPVVTPCMVIKGDEHWDEPCRCTEAGRS